MVIIWLMVVLEIYMESIVEKPKNRYFIDIL